MANVRQISVFIENKINSLGTVLGILKKNGINLRAMSIADTRDFGILRLIVNDTDKACEVLAQSRSDPSMSGMGTTMVVCTVVGGYAYIANVGDSRLYLADESGITQITQDHSLIAEMVRLGELTPEQAKNHPDKNIITRAVGTSDEIRIDFFDVRLAEGNQILMCSDGLSNMVEDDRMYQILRDSGTDDKARALIDEANANGGKDNIAVIVIES